MSQALQGSPNLYADRGPTTSINFVTCHDGFTLADLVSYNGKHNQRNGEDNRDGGNDNHSWNGGWEGVTQDAEVKLLRRRQQKNALAMLLLSHGIPMLLMGDELGRTQQGNNNAYCHDNELTWVDWSLLEKENELWRFAQQLIAFRRAHRMLRVRDYCGHAAMTGSDGQGFSPKLSWHGTRAWHPDWSYHSRSLAYLLQDAETEHEDVNDAIYVIMNMYWEPLDFEPPQLPPLMRWHRFADTAKPAPHDICAPGDEMAIDDQSVLSVGGRSVVVLVGRKVSLALEKS
jgi:glycogen operon protein